jgi:hypothetical protein
MTVSSTTPASLRICIGRLRRWVATFPLWGKNSAVAVGFFLQALLESLTRPFPAFGHDFLLNFPQGPRPRLFHFHPFPLVMGFLSDEEPFSPPHYGGSVKLRPASWPFVVSS